MTETVKEGDFVEIDYVGIINDGNIVFDTTKESVAKENELFDPNMTYGTISICIGQGQILGGLDKNVEGLEIGKEHVVTLSAEQAFGKKDGKLMKLIPSSVFKKQNINPYPGLQINVDGMMGIIRNVSGGRIVVDFNHPLASKELKYKIDIKRKITDDKEKISSLVVLALNQTDDAIEIDITDKKAIIKVKKKVEDELINFLKERIIKLVESIDDVEFVLPNSKVPKKEEKQIKEE